MIEMKQYSAEFKMEAVKRYLSSGRSLSNVANELGVKPTTLHGWIKKFQESPEVPFPGSGHLRPEDEKLKKLEKENKELKEEIEILKKAAAVFAKNLK